MAEFHRFTTASGQTVLFEIEGASSGESSLEDEMGVLRSVANALSAAIAGLAEENRPEEVEISLGLKAEASGRLAVGLGDDAANLRVVLRWSSDLGGEIADLGP